MPKLIIRSGLPAQEFELRPGTNSIGRAEGNDIQLPDPSVSSSHCEIVVNDGCVMLRDLGSTNGTFLDRQPVGEIQCRPGQSVHCGAIEMLLDDSAAGSAPPPIRVDAPKPVVRLSVARSAEPPAPPPPIAAAPEMENPMLRRALRPRVEDTRTFYQRLAEAFAYPVKGDGWILLVGGTIVFGILSFGSRWFLFSLPLWIFSLGYLFSFMQNVITSTANEEEDMPQWPEVASYWDDIIVPFFKLAATWAACLAPAVICLIYADGAAKLFAIPLAILGLIYLPMGLLAVSMYDTVFALNPMLVVPAMFRVPLQYFVTCIIFAFTAGVTFGVEFGISFVEINAVVAIALVQFVSLYFLTVQMRILGLLYRANRAELGWFS